MAKKKKPEACACPDCGRTPVIVKISKYWRVACPYLDCGNISSYGGTETEAILKWNKGEVVKA